MSTNNQPVAEPVESAIETRYSVPNHETPVPNRQAVFIFMHRILHEYGLASVFVAAALLTTMLIQPLFPYPFLFLFFAAVVASAWLGGMLPGLFVVLVSTLMADYFFLPPVYSFAIKPTEVSYFAAFVLCSLVASWRAL